MHAIRLPLRLLFVIGSLSLLVTTGCVRTDASVYSAADPGLATIFNPGRMPIYLPGCAPFVIERSLDGAWVDLGPPFVCFWEGIAVEVGSGESVATPFQAPTDTGRYRVRYTFSAGCDPGLPLSQANCEMQGATSVAEFEVERDLCDPAEFGCQFVPGAPNYLCPDGESVGGPAADCTRDPVSGMCGYEFLSCP